MNIHPRPEYPRPDFIRKEWLNLNGGWTYTFDFGLSGVERGLPRSLGYAQSIVVPFCPESSLSGVEYKDFISAIWYQRTFAVPGDWKGYKIILHIGAADYESEVFVNGRSAGRHWGGSASFSVDVTPYLSEESEQNLVIAVYDGLRSGTQLGGKQSLEYGSVGCFYSRVTGIWQSVWLEPVDRCGLKETIITPLFDQGAFVCLPTFFASEKGNMFTVRVKDGEDILCEETISACTGNSVLCKLPSLKAWSPDSPFLYDIEYTVANKEGAVVDFVQSYTGIRKVHIEGDRFYLNNEPIYLRMVLDQGFYPTGIWTAPSVESLKHDIELSMAAGFNGARLHQKVFEPWFHYWADKLGYLTWAESPSWGLDIKSGLAARNFLSEWREIVTRDRNHPSIIAWTTLNETWDISDRKHHSRVHLEAYDLTRSLDPTRPINNASGGCHVRTDLYTVHIYEQNPELLAKALKKGEWGEVFRTLGDKEVPYEGQPYLVDEFGGIKWISDISQSVKDSWGYGESPKSLEEFYSRLEGQVDALLSHEHITGYCYTQLTDVEQEQNGLYNYDRTHKFDITRLHKIFSRNR